MDPRRLRILKILAAAGVAMLVLGFLGLRFGAQLIAPLLPDVREATDSQAAATRVDSTPVMLASADTSSTILRYGPFVIDGRSYRFEIQRDTGAQKPREAARRVQAFDATGRVVYDENLFLRRDSSGSEDWLEFVPTLIEDASGIPRGFEFRYSWFPSAPSSGVAFNMAAPRGDSLVVLTPTVIGYYGNEASLPAGNTRGSQRLLPGNRMVIESDRGWFTALVNLRVDFGCAARSASCVRIDMPDSVAGLAYFVVKPTPMAYPDTTVAVDLYAAPHSGYVEKVVIPSGQHAEILGGASNLYFDRTPSLYLGANDEWIEVRIDGKRGWVTGGQAFRAIGLQQVG